MNALAGTWPLLRLALRRDRVLLPAWLALFVLMAGVSAEAVSGLYPTVADRVSAARGINASTSLVAMFGPIYDLSSAGALAMFKMGTMGAVMLAILTVVIVVRHTRAEEETQRLEMLGATVVGRAAPLAATGLLVVGMNVVLGVLTALTLIAYNLEVAGAWSFGMAWAACGIAFGAVAAVTAQLGRTARAATAMGSMVVAVAYLLRAVGDATSGVETSVLSWLSPVGWSQQVRAFAGNRWSVLVVPLGFAALVGAAGYAINRRRDMGAGLIADRAGPAEARPQLSRPWGLAWRLHRGLLAGWLVGFVVMGAVLGGLASNIGGLLDSPQAMQLITQLGGVKGIADAFLAAELSIAGVVAAAFAVQATGRLRVEETAGRAEPLLSGALPRSRWASGHLAVALLGSAALLLALGVAVGAAHAWQTGDAGQVGRLVAAAAAQIPAAWVLVGVVMALVGLLPRATAGGWAALVGFLLLGELGPVLRLPQVVMDLSPFAHVPRLPGGPFSVVPLAWLLLVAVGLVAVGLFGLSRRDVGSAG